MRKWWWEKKCFWHLSFSKAADLKLNFYLLGNSSTAWLSEEFATVLKSAIHFQFSGCCTTGVLCSANDVFQKEQYMTNQIKQVREGDWRTQTIRCSLAVSGFLAFHIIFIEIFHTSCVRRNFNLLTRYLYLFLFLYHVFFPVVQTRG